MRPLISIRGSIHSSVGNAFVLNTRKCVNSTSEEEGMSSGWRGRKEGWGAGMGEYRCADRAEGRIWRPCIRPCLPPSWVAFKAGFSNKQMTEAYLAEKNSYAFNWGYALNPRALKWVLTVFSVSHMSGFTVIKTLSFWYRFILYYMVLNDSKNMVRNTSFKNIWGWKGKKKRTSRLGEKG